MFKVKFTFKNNCWTISFKGKGSKKAIKYLEKIKKENKINSEEKELIFFFKIYGLVVQNNVYDNGDYFSEAEIIEKSKSIVIKLDFKDELQFEYLLDQL